MIGCWITKPYNAPELSVARSSPIQVVPQLCAPFFSVLGTPPEPLGMVAGRVGHSIDGLGARLIPGKWQHRLDSSDGRLVRFLVAGTELAPFTIGQACAAPGW